MKFSNGIPTLDEVLNGGEQTPSPAALESQLHALIDRVRELPGQHDPLEKAGLLLNIAHSLIGLERGVDAWSAAREAFDMYVQAEHWERAVECCNVMYLTDQPDALVALGQGVWLSVTYPVDPELTVVMLEHVINDTPDDSDGAAVAASAAYYIADLRAEGKIRENLLFFTSQLLANVARRHSRADDQEHFEAWFKKLELHDPALFLPRLRNVVDVLVQDSWWIDRDALRAKLPVN